MERTDRRMGWKAILVSVPVLVVLTLPLGAFGARTSDSQLKADIETLASDSMQGRDNATPGSTLAQAYLISQLKLFARGANSGASGDDAFKQTIPGGTNIVAIIPGTAPPNEYVIVGAHYDHLAFCFSADFNDDICNGATDNATGVANVLAIGRAIATQRRAPRRSVILAFWDQEEDGLLGSNYYVQHPLVPLGSTVAYVNYDIQGAILLPKLRRSTFAIASETGGPQFARTVRRAVTGVGLRTRFVSSIFGQYRSDYVNFIDAQIPTVFFSDSTGPCYHTAQDETDVVDFTKLSRGCPVRC